MTEPTPSELIVAIEAYHNLGIPVIPFYISPEGKKKPIIDSWEKWKDQAQTDIEFKAVVPKILETKLFGVVTGTKIAVNDEPYYFAVVDRDIKDPKLSEEIKAKSKQAIGLMRTTRMEGTINKGEHLHYYSRNPAKGKKLNDIGLELLGLGNLCVMYPSEGYTRINDNPPTIVDDINDIFFNAIEQAGLSSKRARSSTLKTIETPKQHRRKPIRPCFAKLMEKNHLEHLEKVALIYELHYCGRTDQEIYDVFHDNQAWEPTPDHTYSVAQTDSQIQFTLDKAKSGSFRYLKGTLSQMGICQSDCPFITDLDCRKSKLKTSENINPIADVAKPIEQKYKFVVEKLEKGSILYFYDEKQGIYTGDTEEVIKKEICVLLDDDTRDKFYKEVENWIKYNPKTARVTFNVQPELIAVNNGVLDLFSRKLYPFSPDYYITNKIPHNYMPDAKKDSLTAKFLTEIMSEKNRLQHQEFMGKTLWRKAIYQVAPVLVGEGNNGKSVLIDIDTFLLGKQNVANVTFQALTYDKFASADLKDKMANFCADMPAEALKHLGTVKMIITSDFITSQHKHKDPFKWQPVIGMMFSCNHAPEIDVTEDNIGTFRRFMMWEFPFVFSPDDPMHREDKQLRDKLLTEEEAESYLNYCLDGLDRLRQQKEYTSRDSVQATRKAYIKKSNSCQSFTDEAIEITDNPDDWFFTDTAYRLYVSYCHKEKLPPQPKAALSAAIERFCNGAERFKRRQIGETKGTPLSAYRYVKLRTLTDITIEAKDQKQKTLVDSQNVPSVPSVPPSQTSSENRKPDKNISSKQVVASGTIGTVGTNPEKSAIGESNVKGYSQLACVFCQKGIMDNDWVQDNFTWNKPAHRHCYDEKKSQLAIQDETEASD